MLPWFCSEGPTREEDERAWRFYWSPPPPDKLGGAVLPEIQLTVDVDGSSVCYEERCRHLEDELCKTAHGLVCQCCLCESSVCASCVHAIGLHHCEHAPGALRWRKGSLHGGKLDVERCLWNLHRKAVPMQKIEGKAQEFVSEELITMVDAERIIAVITAERHLDRVANADAEEAASEVSSLTHKLNQAQLVELLRKREVNMRSGGAGGGVPDQHRVYCDIIGAIERGEYLRMMVQASAGALSSYLIIKHARTTLIIQAPGRAIC